MNDDAHLCELCDEPCDPERDMELPNGDYVHARCADDYNADQSQRALERQAANFSGAEYEGKR
jgi:hypothetical protein